jgi:tetratricopeptide (TPR) repeat protein
MEDLNHNISQEQQETFERYLMDQMDLAEKKGFEEKLRTQIDLSQNFYAFKVLFEVVEENALRATMDGFHNQMAETETLPILRQPKLKPWFAIAATIAITIGVGLWFFSRPQTGETLYKDHYSQDPGLPTVMGDTDNYAFYEAMVDYKLGQYTKALEKWEKQLSRKPNNDTLNYFIASALIGQDKIEPAMDYYTKVIQQPNSNFKEEAYFYKGLIYLRQGKLEQAKTQFKKSGSPRANEILAKIKTKAP